MLGIFITILGVTYFYRTYYSECAVDKKKESFTISLVSRVIPKPARMIITVQRGLHPLSGRWQSMRGYSE